MEEFEKRATKINGVFYWPGLLSFQDYKNEIPLAMPQRNAWCYGNVGILCGLHHAAKALHDEELQALVKDQISQLSLLNIKEHLLDSPIICHGYSGLILLFHWSHSVHKNIGLKHSIQVWADIIIKRKDNLHGLSDIGVDGSKRETFAILDGSVGSVLSLLLLVKENTSFQKISAFI